METWSLNSIRVTSLQVETSADTLPPTMPLPLFLSNLIRNSVLKRYAHRLPETPAFFLLLSSWLHLVVRLDVLHTVGAALGLE